MHIPMLRRRPFSRVLWKPKSFPGRQTGRKARSLGSIGVGGGFAIFPDYATGRAALRKVLKDGYPTTTLFRLIRYYAPPKENDVKRYRKLLSEFKGLSLKRTVENLTSKELGKLVDGIERTEGWREGEENPAESCR